MTKYKSISQYIEAVQWLGNNADEVEKVTGLNIDRELLSVEAQEHVLYIDDIRPGVSQKVYEGDYIIKTDNGLLACRKEIFKELWREVNNGKL